MKKVLMISLALSLGACSKAPNDNKTTAASTATQGVSDTEIVVGGMHDLSGIFAAFSVPAVKAANQHFDAVNQNGIHGRKIRHIVEDHGYQVPKAVQAANKLVTRDNVFAMLMNLGTPQNQAAFPIMDKAGVTNVLPLAPSRPMLEGDLTRRFLFGPTYYEAMYAGFDHFAKDKKYTKFCTMYIPSDFGKETMQAAQDVAAAHAGVSVVESSSHRPDETDFSGALAKLKKAGCQLVGVSLGVRPSITVVGTARAMGWKDVDFLLPQSGAHDAVAEAPGGITEGIYVMTYWPSLKFKPSEAAKKWKADYKAKTGGEANSGAVFGYMSARILTEGLKNAGKDLTTESFSKGLEAVDFVDDVTGVHVKMSPKTHKALNSMYLAQVKNGVWQPLTKITSFPEMQAEPNAEAKKAS